MVAWICSSDRHPPTQAGTKTLFKAVKAFEKRESCDEAAKAGGANVDCGFPMISQIFWSCFCHFWNLFLFVLLNGFWRCLHLSWETIWEILEKNRVVFFFNAAEPLDDWELMSRDSWECGEDSWWREPSQGGWGEASLELGTPGCSPKTMMWMWEKGIGLLENLPNISNVLLETGGNKHSTCWIHDKIGALLQTLLSFHVIAVFLLSVSVRKKEFCTSLRANLSRPFTNLLRTVSLKTLCWGCVFLHSNHTLTLWFL